MRKGKGRALKTIKVGKISQWCARGAPSVYVPFIRLSGKWLERVGFCAGEYVEIRISDREIKLVCLGEATQSGESQMNLFDTRDEK